MLLGSTELSDKKFGLDNRSFLIQTLLSGTQRQTITWESESVTPAAYDRLEVCDNRAQACFGLDFMGKLKAGWLRLSVFAVLEFDIPQDSTMEIMITGLWDTREETKNKKLECLCKFQYPPREDSLLLVKAVLRAVPALAEGAYLRRGTDLYLESVAVEDDPPKHMDMFYRCAELARHEDYMGLINVIEKACKKGSRV